jgi:hypothetical protein
MLDSFDSQVSTIFVEYADELVVEDQFACPQVIGKR